MAILFSSKQLLFTNAFAHPLLYIKFYDMKNIAKPATRNKYSQISELGSRLNLSFSSQMSLGNKIIALDGIKKKLLVMHNSDVVNWHYIVNLKEVKTVSI